MNPPIGADQWAAPYLLTLSDPQLLQACRAGDEEAWQHLLTKYEQVVYAIPLHYGLSREKAATITQIVFSALLQSLDSWREESNLERWLFLITRRHTWRTLRCQQQITDAELNTAPSPFFSTEHPPTGERVPPTLPSAVYGALLQRFADYVHCRQQPDLFQRQRVTLTFDSLHQPTPAGMRAGLLPAARHYVYTNPLLAVTLHTQSSRQGAGFDLIGQLLPNAGDLITTPFVVQLVQQGQEVAITLTDIVGVFGFGRLKPGNYDLLFSTDTLDIELSKFLLTA